MVDFIKIPFALTGTQAPVPRGTQPDGSMSFNQGFTLPYEQDPDTEPTARDIPRDQFNYLMYVLSNAINQWQTQAFPDYITPEENDPDTPTPYSYSINATVRYVNGWASTGAANYVSLVDSNTADPTDSTKWGLVRYSSPEVVGTAKLYFGDTLPTGYLWCNGTTIGSASSGGTARANADTFALYSLLWTSMSNVQLPIQNSSGVPTTRGVSAQADFDANKRLPLPDMRDLVPAGKGNMGGLSDRGLITTGGAGFDGTLLGNSGGAQTHTLTVPQIPPHNHTFTVIGTAAGVGWPSGSPNTAQSNTYTTDNTGGGQAHNNTQPTMICNYIIALGTA